MDLPGRGANEHGLVQEEGTPLPRGGVVFGRAAEELKLPVDSFHEPGIAEHVDEVAFIPEEPTNWIQFHMGRL